MEILASQYRIHFLLNFLFLLGVTAIFGIRTRFDETDTNVKRIEV